MNLDLGARRGSPCLVGGSLGVEGQLGLHSKNLSQKAKIKKNLDLGTCSGPALLQGPERQGHR